MESFPSNIDLSNSEILQQSSRRKRRKIGDPQGSHNQIPWRSHKELQIYSSKLVQALRRVLRGNPSSTTKPTVGQGVRETADRVLAVTAKGRTRWSRAMLATLLCRSKFQRQHKKVKRPANGWRKPEIIKERSRLQPVQKKARVLGRLVPGCRKVSFPSLLEEATDYISALEMQVRAMTALTELLTCGEPAEQLGWTRP